MHPTASPSRRPPVSPYHLTPASLALLRQHAALTRRRLAERRAAREQLKHWGQR